jgi:hypothetical protein
MSGKHVAAWGESFRLPLLLLAALPDLEVFFIADVYILEFFRLCYCFGATEQGRRQLRGDIFWLARFFYWFLQLAPRVPFSLETRM